MTSDTLESKLRALEDEIFFKIDQKLWEKLREDSLREEKREQLRKLMHVEDEAMLDGLIEEGIDNEKIAVLWLVPLVVVAWSDGHVTDAERKTILEIASPYSERGSDEFIAVLKRWLRREPSPDLWVAWQTYLEALRQYSLGPATEMLADKLYEDANRVAHASNSFLSFGRVCKEKQEALDRLKKALKGE